MYIAIAALLLIIFIYMSFKWPGVALIAALPVSMLFISVTYTFEPDNEYDALIAYTIAGSIYPLTLLVLIITALRTDYTERKWPHILVFWFLRITYYILMLVFFSSLMNFFGVGTWFLYLLFERRIFVAHRQSITLDVVSTISSCIRQNLPLPMALQTAAAEYKGRRKKIFLNISKWLTEGYCLSGAVKIGYPKCPTYITSMIEAAEQVNQLPQAIKNIEAELRGKLTETGRIHAVNRDYPVFVFTSAVFIMLGLSIFILPTFAEVLYDMGDKSDLPRSTQILVGLSEFTRAGKGVVAAMIVSVLLFITFGLPVLRGIYRKIPRHAKKPSFIIQIGDFIKWYLPVLHSFEYNYSIMRITNIIRIALNAGCPVNEAIERAGDIDVNNCFRKRLYNWLKRVENGQNISAAALDTGMGNSIAWAFDDKINSSNTPEILEMLEKFYRANYNFKINIFRAVSFPVMILLLSFLVGFIVYAMFIPGVALITSLTETAMP